MTYINKNFALNQLEELVQTSIQQRNSYFPDSFNEQQQEAIEIFKKRIFLESIIEETISFNKSLSWEQTNKKLNLTTTAEALIEVFKLRSDVYKEYNYDREFPDTIEGLNFDKYDKNSAILFSKTNNSVSGTIRLIFDSKDKLPSENKFSFDYMRERHDKICELSRLIVKNQSKGLNVNFKHLMKGIHIISTRNNIGVAMSGIQEDHFHLYKRFGGMNKEHELPVYGNIDTPFIIISWNPSQISKFSNKAILEN